MLRISQDFGYPNAIFPGVASPNLSHTNYGESEEGPQTIISNTLFPIFICVTFLRPNYCGASTVYLQATVYTTIIEKEIKLVL